MPLSSRTRLHAALLTLSSAAAAAVAVSWSAHAAPAAGREVISTTDAPKAIGPYSQGIAAGNLVFVAGQTALDPKTGTLVEGGIEGQAKCTLDNVKAILAAAGLGMNQVVMSTCYLTNLDDFAKFNAVYATYFPGAPPARATVQVARLPKDALVEVAVIAAR